MWDAHAEEKTLAQLCLTHKDAFQSLEQNMRAAGLTRAPTPADSTHGGNLMGTNAFNSHSQNLSRRGLSAAASQQQTRSCGGAVGGISMQQCSSPSSPQGETQGGAAGCFREDRRSSFEQASVANAVHMPAAV